MKFLWKKLIAGFASLLLLLTPMTVFASAADFTSIVDTSAPIHSVALQPGDSANVTVNLVISGRQDGTATFEVYQHWTLSGGTFVGSSPKEITVQPRPQNAAVTNLSYNASITVQPGQAAGTFELVVGAFDITNSNITGGKLAAGSSASYTVTVEKPVATVDKTAPALTIPADKTVEATGALTPVDIGSATATDDSGSAVITNDAPSGLLFPLGRTAVVWTAEDASGNVATATQYITVVDTTAPALTIPADRTVEATGALTPVDIGSATATDNSGYATVTNNAPSALTFPLGTTSVIWTAEDASGNVATATQYITIVDTTAPVLTLPTDRTVEATDVLTPVDIGSATATDNSGYAAVTSDAPATLTFPLGTTSVIWTAEDASGNAATATEYITIVDTTAPTLTAPASVTAIVGAPINLGQAAANDIFLAAVTNNAPAVFPLGVTTVTWTATDTSGNVTTATQTVTVRYDFKGIQQPINLDGSSVFKAGSTVPVKFQLKNASGQYVSTAVASLSYQKVTSNVAGAVNEAVSTSAAGINNLFRYDTTSNQYVFNLSTKGMATGAYRLTITLDDGATYSVIISLK